jgi:Protein of unknown function (DUF1573)
MNLSTFTRIAASAVLLGLLVSCTPAKKSDTNIASGGPATAATPAAAPAMPVTAIKFDTEMHDFGKITNGEKVSYRYTFTNVGKNPLKISNVKPTCGCTTPEWTKEEIAPGGKGYVVVEFDSKGRGGTNNKTTEVFANTEPPVTPLRFTAEVSPEAKK